MSKITVLVVDKEHQKYSAQLEVAAKQVAETSLIEIEFEFIYSRLVSEAISFLDRHDFVDLIITDLILDDNTGFHMLSHAQENHPHIPTIVFSSSDKAADVKLAGFDQRFRSDEFFSKSDVFAGQGSPSTDALGVLLRKALSLVREFGRIHVSDGILITHGTDTMAWAFAVLRYGLYDLKTNVIITGSQLPLEGAFSPSDAIGNMLTSLKLLNMLEPPNVIQVFNDGVHIFNKNLVKVKKWSFDAFSGSSFGKIESEQLRIAEDDVFPMTKENILHRLHFIRTGGTIDSIRGSEGLEANADFTEKYVRELQGKYFDEWETIRLNPKDSSLFSPHDWEKLLETIDGLNLGKADKRFDWRILPVFPSPFMSAEYYEMLADLVITKYAGAIVLGYGAGNVNIFDSDKTESTRKLGQGYIEQFGAKEFEVQRSYSFSRFLERIEEHNKNASDDYKFVIMNSQVPVENYDIDYQAGRIPLYYGAVPSGDLSYPEAQTKLAFIVGHKDLLLEKANSEELTYQQLVKSCFLAGVKFNRKSNQTEFLRISETECGCRVKIHKKNIFVKRRFEDSLDEICELLKQAHG